MCNYISIWWDNNVGKQLVGMWCTTSSSSIAVRMQYMVCSKKKTSRKDALTVEIWWSSTTTMTMLDDGGRWSQRGRGNVMHDVDIGCGKRAHQRDALTGACAHHQWRRARVMRQSKRCTDFVPTGGWWDHGEQQAGALDEMTTTVSSGWVMRTRRAAGGCTWWDDNDGEERTGALDEATTTASSGCA